MEITRELISYVASLSRLKLAENEVDEMKNRMSELVEYMGILNQLDTENIEPLSHIFAIENVLRQDTVVPSYSRDDILSNAPEHTEEAFVVPKTVE